MSWVTSFFGGTKTAEEVVKVGADTIRGVGNWIDNQQYTEQERAEGKYRAVQTGLDFVKATFNENSIRNVTRRIMAWSVVWMVTFVLVVSVTLIVGGWDYTVVKAPDATTVISYSKVDRIITVAETLQLGWAFGTVLVAYFGVHVVRAWEGRKKGGKNDNGGGES